MAVASLDAASSPQAWPVEDASFHDWRAGLRPLLEAPGHFRAGAWLAAGLSHGLVALAAVLVALEIPANEGVERPREALTVEILAAPTPGIPGDPSAEAEQATAPAPPAQPYAAIPERFEVALPQRAWPDALEQYVAAQRAQAAADAALFNLSPGVLGALRGARYCSSTAVGIAADIHRCGMWRTRAIIEARVAALDPNLFRDADAGDARRAAFQD